MTEPEESPVPRCPACGATMEGNLAACFSCGYARRSPPLKKGQRISGRYELTGVLGRGGMGTVYRAHDHSLDEEVALKVLSDADEDSADADRRFRAEIRLARKVRHPNVCAIHEYGQLDDLQYIVMELVHGQDLRKYLDSRGRLTTAEALDLAREIGEGLQAIHDAGVIHRDLKLANVMRDGAGRLRLMDFGIAKKAGDMMSTVTGHIVGTPEYMSPEQVQGQPVDARADIYSLGVMTYELLAGRVPFKAETPLGVIMMQVNEPPELNDPAIPGAVANVLRKALAKKPEDRYETAQAFVSALTAARASLDATAAGGPGAGASPTTASKPQPRAETSSPGGRPGWIPTLAGLLAILGVVAWLIVRTGDPAPRPQEPTGRSLSEQPQRAGPPGALPSAALPMSTRSPATPTPPPSVEPTAMPRRVGSSRLPSHSPDPIQAPARDARSPSATPSPAVAILFPLPTVASTPVPAPASAPTPAPSPTLPATTPDPVGYLQIKVAPFAQVTVDGRDSGTVSEAKTLELGPGRHVIRFLHPGYQPLQRIVTVKPGDTVRVLVDLKLDGIAK